MKYLVTGGAGYIGSHTVVQLLQRGDDVVVLDNLSSGSPRALERASELAGRSALLVNGDILDRELLVDTLAGGGFSAVIHFAGLKAVGESMKLPLQYFRNNVAGTLTLLEVMSEVGVKRLVFSSSATVYGVPDVVPIMEGAPRQSTNPYGRSKLIVEHMLEDLSMSDPEWGIANLRYFNPVGAHPSGSIGEDPVGTPNNLMPYVTQVACRRLERLSIFGGDYPTIDGTGVRDYIHVQDLARGHLAALDYLSGGSKGMLAVNLGTGRGVSVLELVRAFEDACGVTIPFEIVSRRLGDVASCFADPSAAGNIFGWKAELGIQEMCRDAWNWQSRNPLGYRTSF